MTDAHTDKIKTKDIDDGVEEAVSHFKLTLTHTNHVGLEKAADDIDRKVKQIL